MEAHAEHQQDHADFCELTRNGAVCLKTWREWPDRNAGEQIPDEGRYVRAARSKAERERHDERCCQREQESRLMFHR